MHDCGLIISTRTNKKKLMCTYGLFLKLKMPQTHRTTFPFQGIKTLFQKL